MTLVLSDNFLDKLVRLVLDLLTFKFAGPELVTLFLAFDNLSINAVLVLSLILVTDCLASLTFLAADPKSGALRLTVLILTPGLPSATAA
tara:strand:+ start:83 stop:352 length:270 start_codon:yes stop_codon:yes gene_type:complete